MNDGGPAFPIENALKASSLVITVRDYFAAHALSALLIKGGHNDKAFAPLSANPNYVRLALEYADAMIKQSRKQTKPSPAEFTYDGTTFVCQNLAPQSDPKNNP